jgi:hypothetical protein
MAGLVGQLKVLSTIFIILKNCSLCNILYLLMKMKVFKSEKNQKKILDLILLF